jgi:hypothetical protein
MTARGNCVFCSEPVRDMETAAWPVTGWEAERYGGGANAIIGRTRVEDGRIAHATCAKRGAQLTRRGIAPGQESLSI